MQYFFHPFKAVGMSTSLQIFGGHRIARVFLSEQAFPLPGSPFWSMPLPKAFCGQLAQFVHRGSAELGSGLAPSLEKQSGAAGSSPSLYGTAYHALSNPSFPASTMAVMVVMGCPRSSSTR